MSEEEDAANAAKNEQIRVCRHVPVWTDVRGTWCRLCGARFAVVLKPRMARPPAFEFDDQSEDEE